MATRRSNSNCKVCLPIPQSLGSAHNRNNRTKLSFALISGRPFSLWQKPFTQKTSLPFSDTSQPKFPVSQSSFSCQLVRAQNPLACRLAFCSWATGFCRESGSRGGFEPMSEKKKMEFFGGGWRQVEETKSTESSRIIDAQSPGNKSVGT